MALAKTKAKQVIDRFQIDSPEILSHLEEICWELGAPVRYVPMSGADARLTMTGETGIISIAASDKGKPKSRFSIAHELGHFLLHKDISSALICGQNEMRCWFSKQENYARESDANEFSSELLMPDFLVTPTIKDKRPNFSLIDGISETFGASTTAAAIRFTALTKEAVAIVAYNKSNGYLWSARSKLFIEQNYFIPSGKLSSYTLAHDAVNSSDSGTMQSIDATAWLNLPSWLAEETIKEQTRYSREYDFGISLLWLDSGKLIRN